jgi:very-short-patch-repair endonuclease
MAEEAQKHVRAANAIGQRAKELRKAQTAAEAILWEQIRARRINGLKFRRQHPVGRFIADFCCPETRLIVEVDGPIHSRQRQEDAARTARLEEEGYQVVRFTNDDVVNRLDSVIQSLRELTAIDPSPTDGRGVPAAAAQQRRRAG